MKKTIDWTMETVPQILGCEVYENGHSRGFITDIYNRGLTSEDDDVIFTHIFSECKHKTYKSRTGELLPMGQVIEIEKKWDGDAMIRAQIDGWWPIMKDNVYIYGLALTGLEFKSLIKPNQGPRSSWETMTIEQATEKYGSEV